MTVLGLICNIKCPFRARCEGVKAVRVAAIIVCYQMSMRNANLSTCCTRSWRKYPLRTALQKIAAPRGKKMLRPIIMKLCLVKKCRFILVCWSWQIWDQENRSCTTIPHFAKLSRKGFVLLSVTCIIPLSRTLKHEWRQPQFKRPETPISTLKLHQSVCFSDLISHDKKCFCMTMTVIFDVSIRT